MKTPQFNDQLIYKDSEFSYMLSFEEEYLNSREHFIEDCGWTLEEYKNVIGQYWFVAKVTAFKGSIECGSAYLGGCCYKNLKEIMQDGTPDKILSGYAPQMIEEAKEEALRNLSN